jgi:hypothetical protein
VAEHLTPILLEIAGDLKPLIAIDEEPSKVAIFLTFSQQ